jgi:hypothetical protein
MRNEYTGQVTSSEEEFAFADKLQAALANEEPHNLTMRVNAILAVRGRATALKQVEDDFAGIVAYADEQGWPEVYKIGVLYDALLKLALANPDDTWSGRNNDARRTQSDAAREVYNNVARWLRVKLTNQHPSNQAMAL